ncbi:MAG: DNA polymerase Y family protein [Pseudomonadota bacterium]
MSARRILSVWFPRLGAERLLRRDPPTGDAPFAVVRETGQMQVISSVSEAAQTAGVHVGQPLRDAHAMCGHLVTRLQNPQAEEAFLRSLTRWAGRFSPWIASEAPDALLMDISGCAHLFGGEAALVQEMVTAAANLGLTARCGLADTVGAAWALARFAGVTASSTRSGDAIDQEARATRSRAAKRRHWERGGAAPALMTGSATDLPCIAAPGKAYTALSPLPVAALRLEPEMVADLGRVGLRTVGDLLGQPRAPLARRYGKGLILRLDQAIGAAAEPVSPAAPAPRFATRLTLPEPIGLRDDVEAGIDRLVARLCQRLADKSRGARRVRFEAWRVDHTMQWIEVGLARATDRPDRITPLLLHRLEEIDAGFGIEMLRLDAVQTEALNAGHATGHMEAANAARARYEQQTAVEDLVARIGGRLGLDAITRRHPVDTHIPEKTAKVLAAAWSEPAEHWPAPPTPRPLLLWAPEPVHAPETPRLSAQFRWRGRTHHLAEARGPERIAPEWWLDEPDWRTGVRDYWQVITAEGERLWLFYAHGAAKSAGWFCHGRFA